ncbi:uncharacterized protein K452DRAFT_290280 [Aplosporella prunicola CBS 121167]|uniref:Alpha-ketoglutarate-dependent dioxygenase AlkB-like domain-containing protein n=1 Tax=Aplosporella prunicola CBS 121167 TaxID=1176127 RepID=A0A6A6B710_9PEZI|nr:uncharacterized protein K452DRAFT_290280 [Aplosporella prunicola CBS 121167]KAF2139183.1 hypothetical protein K452DRAFT_290280 [Aplosporella prunicola CBS 121167]
MANKTVNEEQGGPDDMFTGLQTELEAGKIDLRRRLLSSTTLRGGQLTQHFCLNYGMYYKFVAQTASESFDTAPAAIKNTRSRLNWVARHALQLAQTPNPSLDFNEELLIGYFEKQAIDYHDDGEAGLGPTIASLSLGWPAPMKLRMKEKHYNGVSKAGVMVTDKPMPGCEKYSERLAAWQELEALKATGGEEAAATYKQRVKALPKELGLKAKGNARDVVTLQLRHGDVMLMHGADIQKYYEHAVVPDGALRFALTCRYIDPMSLSEDIRPHVGPDSQPYDGAALPEPPK